MIIGRIAVSQIAGDRREVSHLRIGDNLRRIEDDGKLRPNKRRALHLGLPREPAYLEMAVFFFDIGQTRDAIDVDEIGRPGQPKLHHRNQALATAKDLCIVAVLLEESDRLRNGRGAQVLEGWGDHSLLHHRGSNRESTKCLLSHSQNSGRYLTTRDASAES